MDFRADPNLTQFRQQVRTFLREYLTTSKLQMANLQLTHVGKLTENQYYNVYGGYLEEMFAGVGAEWMYRRFGSGTAVGVDVNAVQQVGERHGCVAGGADDVAGDEILVGASAFHEDALPNVAGDKVAAGVGALPRRKR